MTGGLCRDEALAACERGDKDAPTQLAAALRVNPADGGPLIAEAQALSAAREVGALVRLQAMLRQSPLTPFRGIPVTASLHS